MENKKGNAFTLIELLAIIVILAIIAVITVPIILNIIENSKRGAATDSAYGYKDAIDKFYVSKLSIDSGYNIPDGLHTLNDFDTMGVTVSGKKPAGNSFLKTVKNKVIQGCLQYDEYKVEFIDGRPQNAQKGTCKTVEVVYVDVNENGKIDMADTVKIENDEFYVLEEPFGGKVKLLPKYNLDSNSRQSSSNSLSLSFSSTQYYNGHLSNYPRDKYDGYYVYTRDTTNNLYSYVENYKNYLVELGAYFVTDARPMSYEEAKNAGCKSLIESNPNNSCPSFFGNYFWLGSAGYINGDANQWVYYYSPYTRYLNATIGTSTVNSIGVRPLIEVIESGITDEYRLTYDSRGGSQVESKTIVTGTKVGTLPVNPTKDGAIFEGWYTDKEYTSEKLTTETIPVGSTTYYAKYALSKAEYTDTDGSGTINLGDTVKILDDEFYVIAAPSGGKVKILPKYNLNTGSRQENGHNPSVAFSGSTYWTSNSNNYNLDSYNVRYVYRDKNNEDTNNNLKTYINNYKDYLYLQGAEFVTDVRLMSYEDAKVAGCRTYSQGNSNNSCPQFFGNRTFWFGSSDNDGNVYYYSSYYKSLEIGNGTLSSCAIHPMVEVSESALQ